MVAGEGTEERERERERERDIHGVEAGRRARGRSIHISKDPAVHGRGSQKLSPAAALWAGDCRRSAGQ